jgi:pimeloyl-ACP methyl ester carboxylesterase
VKLSDPRYIEADGARLAVWERPGAGPPILFLHATGFHARCWDEVIARLPGRRCIALDLRGHGRSAKPEPPSNWRIFGEDAAAVARALCLRGATGVGHSMGGHAVTLAAALEPEAFGDLLLIDPVFLPEQWYTGPGAELTMVTRRRNHWTSWDDMYARFKDRKPFDRWNRKVLLDYCEFGVLPAPDGHGCVLACPPAFEASIYRTSTAPESNIYPEVATIGRPVRVVRASRFTRRIEDFSHSPTAPETASRFKNGKDLHYPERSHFLPMEAPELIAELLADSRA